MTDTLESLQTALTAATARADEAEERCAELDGNVELWQNRSKALSAELKTAAAERDQLAAQCAGMVLLAQAIRDARLLGKESIHDELEAIVRFVKDPPAAAQSILDRVKSEPDREKLIKFFVSSGKWPNQYTHGYLGNSQHAADAVIAHLSAATQENKS